MIKPLFHAKNVPDDELILAELIQTVMARPGLGTTEGQMHQKVVQGYPDGAVCAVGALGLSRRRSAHSYQSVGPIICGNDSPSNSDSVDEPGWDIGAAFRVALDDRFTA